MKSAYTLHNDYSANMTDCDKEEFKYTLNSKIYPSAHAFITTNSSTVAGNVGEPGTGGEFFVVEGKEGYNRIESVKWPNHFIYESSNGYAYIRNDGANMKDDALFLMTSLGDDTITISSKKWPENRMCYMSGRNPEVVFSQSKDDSRMWILDSKAVSSKLPDVEDKVRSVQTRTKGSCQSDKEQRPGDRHRGPAAAHTASSASPQQKNQSIKLNPHRHDEELYLQREPAHGDIDDAVQLGVQSHAQCVIAQCAFNQCARSPKKSEMFTHRYKRKEVRLDHQGDVENSDFGKSRWFANLHVQTQKKTVAQALIEIGPIFGIRYIRRALTESLERQCRARLMADPNRK